MLRSLVMPASTVGENPLNFPIPTGALGTVTVLCGPNGSGKSFVLRMLKDLLVAEASGRKGVYSGWSLEGNTGGTASNYKAPSHKSQMNGVGTLGRARLSKEVMQNDINLKLQIDVFGSLLPKSKLFRHLDAPRWKNDRFYRLEKLTEAEQPDAQKVYWLNDAPEFAKLFEDAFACCLGLRNTKEGMELVLGLGNGIVAPYHNWSDGQKSYFTILATTTFIKPDVYLLDELENFMHPELISKTLSHLKNNCRQTVLSTHHPHLIFGRLVDQVYYVEMLQEQRVLQSDRILRYIDQPSARRKITKLDTDRTKLASTYRLFDIRDAALLASAAQVQASVDAHLIDAARALFECSAAPANPSAYMDRQTQAMTAFMATFSPEPRVVLDWGAGLGRTLTEMGKSACATGGTPLEWLLYEPDPAVRASLQERHLVDGLNVRVIADRESIQGVEAGVVLLTNVLHVLDPEQWCDALQDAWDAVRRAKSGLILITEIYPLLGAEREAIPVPPHWLENLMIDLGFRVSIRSFEVHGAASFCLAATRPPADLNRSLIRDKVVNAWEELNQIYLRTYEGLGSVVTIADQQALLNSVFGLARVSSCLKADRQQQRVR